MLFVYMLIYLTHYPITLASSLIKVRMYKYGTFYFLIHLWLNSLLWTNQVTTYHIAVAVINTQLAVLSRQHKTQTPEREDRQRTSLCLLQIPNCSGNLTMCKQRMNQNQNPTSAISYANPVTFITPPIKQPLANVTQYETQSNKRVNTQRLMRATSMAEQTTTL